VSVVLATYNRGPSLAELLQDLAQQTIPPDEFEVIAVDDGSRVPARESLSGAVMPYRFELIEQPNAGAARARHRAIEHCRGQLLVITDDDMRVPPGFLEAHLAAHPPGSRRVVLGEMRPSADLESMPLFERFHAGALHKQRTPQVRRELHGNALCTGNVSLKRADYLAVGGFDPAFDRSEDSELGLRLEQAGLSFHHSEEAYTTHNSDHTDFAVWRRRARLYGEYEVRISRKYPETPWADPWRFFFGNALSKRPLTAAAVFLPAVGPVLSSVAQRTATGLDAVGFDQAALAATSLLFDLEYFTGVRRASGGLVGTLRACSTYLEKSEARPDAWAARPTGVIGMLGRLLRTVVPPDQATK